MNVCLPLELPSDRAQTSAMRVLDNLLTARFIFGHFVPAIGSRKSPPKAGSAHALMDSRNMHTRGATPFVDVYIFCKSYGFLTPRSGLFRKPGFSEARFIDGSAESVFQNCTFQASHCRSRPTPRSGLFREPGFSEARFIDGAAESVLQNCTFQASHSRSPHSRMKEQL